MRSDDELYMLHYYLERGMSIRELVDLSTTEKLFLMASMALTAEEVAQNGTEKS